jgi:iron(III) transport system substrate-binding protein
MKTLANILFLMVVTMSSAFAADTLVVYSGRSDKFVKPVVEAFTKQTGIKVILHAAKSTELINKLRVEGKRTKADLFISNDAGNLQAGSDMGLFSAIPANMIAAIADNYKAKDRTWVGLSARARVLVVNTKHEDKVSFVKSVLDLSDPRLNGKLAITHSANGSFIAGVTVYQEAIGDKKTLQWLRGMRNNAMGRYYNKHSKIVSDVARGKKWVGLVNHYYIYRHLAKHPKAPVRILIPDQGDKGMGVAWNVAGVAVVKHSAHKQQALKFVEFLASKEGQKIFAEVNREYPTRSDVHAVKEVPAQGSYKVADVPMSLLGKNRKATLDLIEKAGMH